MTDIALHSPPWRYTGNHRYLYIGLAVSLAVHAALLAMRFHAGPQPPRARESSLEVVLLNVRSEAAPVTAEVLAQSPMDGGGEHESGVARSPLPPSATEETTIPLAARQTRQQELEARQRELMTRLAASQTLVEQARTDEAGRQPADVPGARDDPQPTLAQLAQQYAAISARVEDYNRQPRRHYFAPSASAWRFAEYVEGWRERVETVGNEHYPAAARGRVYGSLRMTVFVRADGSVENVAFDAPSEHAVLNEAALDIVRRAAPFAPFPDDVRRDTDVIAITRTWHFQNDAMSTEQP